jgi:hypothetical protein
VAELAEVAEVSEVAGPPDASLFSLQGSCAFHNLRCAMQSVVQANGVVAQGTLRKQIDTQNSAK